MRGSVSYAIHPLLLEKERESYIDQILGLFISYYFLRSNSGDKMQDIYEQIAVRQC